LPAPDGSVDDLLRRGAEFQRAAEHDKAEDCFREALVLEPENTGALHLLADALGVRGYALQERGEFDAAVDCYLEALALVPAQAQIQNNLGNAYRSLGRTDEAIAAYRDAIAADAGLAEAHLNLGTTLHLAGDAQAAAHYRSALQFRPGLVQAALNLGHLLEGDGDVQGAGECYRRAIAARPDFAQAHFNYALQLLLAGDYARGWEEYEWRLRLPELQAHWPFAGRPRWDGADLQGKVILLYAEQGFGDALQFARYVPLVAKRGGRVIVSCRTQLKKLFEQATWDCSVVDAGQPPPAFDLCCSLLSLARIFGTTQTTIPAEVPYLQAEGGKAARWEARLAAAGGVLKVGLVWATEARTPIALSKSLNLDMLGPLAVVPDVIFYSLQKGPAASEAVRAPNGMRLVDVAAELGDFSDTAALISRLDLIVTIDTAVAHLAGALDKPVWTLTHWPPDWRWLLGRDDSPWYPSMRLFRRGRTDAWSDVVSRVGEALQRLPAQRAG